jgi:hypothetical protein
MNPSLLLIPDRYKAAKLYSQIPDSGAGDLTFARNSSATRVNSAGLIEKVRTNIILQSEAFNTTWTPNAAPTITANTTVAPDGTTTGDTIAASGANSGVYQVPTVASGVEHSFSVYIKNISGATDVLLGCDLNPINAIINFNASTGAIISTGAGITGSSVTNAGNGWYRVAGTYVSTGTSNTFVVFGTGVMSFAAWGAQLETGVTTPYIPTTTAAVSVGITADIPRLDYTGGGCPSLLLEPQRTNVALYSEQFGNAAWFKFEGTITPNVISAPDGTISADLFLDTAVSQEHVVEQGVSTGVGVHTWSVFAKAQNLNFLIINAFSGSSNRTWFNLSNGTIGTNAAGSTATITNYGNGWYRCSVTRNYTSGSFLFVAQTAPSDGVFSYTGSVNGIYLWGAQVELGSYVSSYINTLGSSVTRLADAASKTGISSLIGQSEGVLFIETTYNGAVNTGLFNRLITISNGVDNNFISVSKNTSTTELYVYAQTAAGVQVNSNPIANTNLVGTHKIALAYKANDYVLYVDGVQRFTDTSAEVPACSQLNIGNIPFFSGGDELGGGVNQALLFTTRLTNAELQSLTSL